MKLKDQEARNWNSRLPGTVDLTLCNARVWLWGWSVKCYVSWPIVGLTKGLQFLHPITPPLNRKEHYCVYTTWKPTENGEQLHHFSSFSMWNNCVGCFDKGQFSWKLPDLLCPIWKHSLFTHASFGDQCVAQFLYSKQLHQLLLSTFW